MESRRFSMQGLTIARKRFVLGAALLALAVPSAAQAADATVAFKPVGAPRPGSSPTA